MSESLVRKLQADALNDEVRVATLLRTALMISSKLGVDDIREWIENELNGYPQGVCDKDLPSYRLLPARLCVTNPYRGMIPIEFANVQSREIFKARGTSYSIPELETMYLSEPDGHWAMDFAPETAERIMSNIDIDGQPLSVIDKSSHVGILEAVRNRLLEWALQLEANGILGEGLEFSSEERSASKDIPIAPSQETHLGNIGSIGSLSITNVGTTENVTIGDYANVASEVRKYAGDLPEGVRELVMKQLEVIANETAKAEPNQSIVRRALETVRNLCFNVGGSIVASGIVTMIGSVL